MAKFKIEPFIVNSSAAEYVQFEDGNFKIEKDADGKKLISNKDNKVLHSFESTFENEYGTSFKKECFRADKETLLDLNGNVLDQTGTPKPLNRTKFNEAEIEEHSTKFVKSHNGQPLDEYLAEHPNHRSLEENKQLYCHLADIIDESVNDEKFSQKGRISFSHEKNEMFLGVEMLVNDRESPFKFIIRDGQISFPNGASPAELKEMMAFLHARGITGFDLPKHLQEIQQEVQQDALDEKALNNKNIENIPNAIESEPEPEKAGAPKKEIRMKDVQKNMNDWAARNGKRKGLSSFERGSLLNSWTTWTIFPNENRDNMSNLGKKDKDGNRKSNFEAQISARIKNGKLEVRYCLPAGGKMTPMVAEQLIELHAMNGAKKIKFTGICDHDLKEIRTACAKKLIVPIGIGLKVSAAQDMITEARKNHDIGPEILDYERRLAEQIRQNAINKGKGMSETENKFYNDTMEKVAIASYRNLFSSDRGINARLVAVDYNGNDVSKVMASRYAAADAYQLYSRIAISGDKSVSGIAAALQDINAKLGVEANSQEQYQKFLKTAGLNGSENITNITPEQMGALYDSIYDSRLEMSKKRMLELHEDSSQNKSDNFDGLIKKGLGESQKYFDANFTKQYSGIMDKAYPIFPSNNDGLKFGPTEEMLKASKVKKTQPEKENTNNQKKEGENQDRKESFNERKNTFSTEKTSGQSFVEQLVDLHAKNGAKSIRFEAKENLDVSAIKTACADKLIVPQGVELDVPSIKEMITKAQKNNSSTPDKVLDYEKRLVVQLRQNIEKEGKLMGAPEIELYKETMKKVSLANKNGQSNPTKQKNNSKGVQPGNQQNIKQQKIR